MLLTGSLGVLALVVSVVALVVAITAHSERSDAGGSEPELSRADTKGKPAVDLAGLRADAREVRSRLERSRRSAADLRERLDHLEKRLDDARATAATQTQDEARPSAGSAEGPAAGGAGEAAPEAATPPDGSDGT